jgi:hypothetical protein
VSEEKGSMRRIRDEYHMNSYRIPDTHKHTYTQRELSHTPTEEQRKTHKETERERDTCIQTHTHAHKETRSHTQTLTQRQRDTHIHTHTENVKVEDGQFGKKRGTNRRQRRQEEIMGSVLDKVQRYTSNENNIIT